MKKHFSLILFVLLLFTSCREKPLTIDKFIFCRAMYLVYDSLEKPYLLIHPYFEYNKENNFKIAYSRFYGKVSAPPHGLTNFCELDPDVKTIELINQTFINKKYDSTYNSYGDARCSYFLYETSDNKKHRITFGKGSKTPDELIELYRYLEELLGSKYDTKLKHLKPFVVDSVLIDFEREIFLKYPPPTCPITK